MHCYSFDIDLEKWSPSLTISDEGRPLLYITSPYITMGTF